jgi:hypothetical protein
MLTTMCLVIRLVAGLGARADSGTVYQAVMIRAAPGRLVELIDALQARMPVFDQADLHRPVLLRHAQGDQWDLMLLAPVGTLEQHFGAARAARWRDAVRRSGFDEPGFLTRLDERVSWSEELYVNGPPVAALDSALTGAGYFHLEIFQALAGKRDSLLTERAMENDFLRRTHRPDNLIFTKLTGPAWDCFTLGFYRDLPHYAEPARVSAAGEDEAARAAGFESRNHLGPYLRRFVAGHHDTLGPIVR